MTALEVLPRMTQQERTFAETFVKTSDKRASVIAAWPEFADKTAKQMDAKAHRALKEAGVQAYMHALNQQAASAAIDGAAAVFKEWVDIWRADLTQLFQFRRNNCRHCYGKDHKYQWVSESEWAIEYARIVDENRDKDERLRKEPPMFDGGDGFDKQRAVNPACPVCAGSGVEEVWLADTRALPPELRKLITGIEMTRNGVKVSTVDKMEGLTNIAKALGMFQEKIIIQTPGDAGGVPSSIPSDPQLAAQTYMAIIKGDRK